MDHQANRTIRCSVNTAPRAQNTFSAPQNILNFNFWSEVNKYYNNEHAVMNPVYANEA